jgi:hypothetical protein
MQDFFIIIFLFTVVVFGNVDTALTLASSPVMWLPATLLSPLKDLWMWFVCVCVCVCLYMKEQCILTLGD